MMRLKDVWVRPRGASRARRLPGAEEPLLQQIADRLSDIESHIEEIRRTQALLPAVVRALHLGDVPLEPPFDLTARRFGLVSQNGEDGITLALFKRIGATDRRFVEIGCGANGGNSGFLAQELGWSGLMVDARATAIEKIAVKYKGYRVTPVRRKVTREGLNDMLEGFGFTGDVDFFSIDVDGMDFWLWDALEACRPRVMVIEYNYLFDPAHAVTLPYDPGFDLGQQPTRAYRGASLSALTRLGRRKGYRLVATERVNAFFVRNDVVPEVPECPLGLAYRGPANRIKDVFAKFKDKGLPLVLVNEDGTAGDTVTPDALS